MNRTFCSRWQSLLSPRNIFLPACGESCALRVHVVLNKKFRPLNFSEMFLLVALFWLGEVLTSQIQIQLCAFFFFFFFFFFFYFRLFPMKMTHLFRVDFYMIRDGEKKNCFKLTVLYCENMPGWYIVIVCQSCDW